MITQARFANGVKFFAEGFCKRWNVKRYYDINKPAIFVGVYNNEDVQAVNNHKSFALILITGHMRDCFSDINPDNVVVIASHFHPFNLDGYDLRRGRMQIKDFSMFKPAPLGDCVYIYLGKDKYKKLYGYDLMMEVSKKIPYKIIMGYLGHDIEYVKRMYYDKSFINLKPRIGGGVTSASEMAYMGRKTISNMPAPFTIGYETVDDVVNIINEESKKIGTIQPSAVGDFYDIGEEWKQVKYWT